MEKKLDKLPLTCTHWGTYRARVTNGRVQELYGFEHDSDPSPIGSGIIDVQDGPTRISKPSIRKSWLENGPNSDNHLRGVDPFVEVSWTEAEKIVANELKRVSKNFGNSAIFAGSYGWSSAGRFHHTQSQLHRFLNCIGGYTKSKFTYSFAAAETVVPHILGSYRAFLDTCTSWKSIKENTELLVCFGGIPLKNGQISQGGTGNHFQKKELLEASNSKTYFMNISPLKSDLIGEVNGEWIAPRPNTDTAFMLGLAYTLYEFDLVDYDFISKYTVGFDNFLSYLLGKKDGIPKTAQWASYICEIDTEIIKTLAKKMSSKRTMISISWSLTRQDHGEQPFWMAIVLSCMLGQIGLPGGGFGFGYSATNFIGGNFVIPPAAAFPQGINQVKDFIPVARISDLLLKPGTNFEFDGQNYTYPNTKIVYWAGGNPFHHHQDLGLLMKAWKKPDTVICNEWCWNSLAKRSDIVLPCTTPLEREDLGLTPRDPYIIKMSKLTEPYQDSRDDFDIFSGIAKEMGVLDSFTDGKTKEEWQKWIYNETREKSLKQNINMPSYDDFIKKGWFKFPEHREDVVMLEAFRADPINSKLNTPSGKIEIYSETIHRFGYMDCPGHPTWLEPCEWLGKRDKKYQLHLISNQPKDKLHSQLDHGNFSRSNKVNGREPVYINNIDADKRNLKDKDLVKVYNDRGSCYASIVIDNNLRSGVILISTGAWYDPIDPSIPNSPCKNGNPNTLTPDKGTSSLGQGPIAHTCMVEIQLAEGEIPPVTAYEPPSFIQ